MFEFEPRAHQAEENTRRWDQKFASLCRFAQQHGHTRVRRYDKAYEGLGQWVRDQRRAHRAEQVRVAGQQPRYTGRISPEQVAYLDSIDFEWDVVNRPHESANEGS